MIPNVKKGSPLVDALVVQHLVLGEDVPVVAEELLCLLVDVPVHDVDEGRGALQVLQVDVVEDPGVDDHVVLDIVHREAAVDGLPLRDSHPVVVHLLEVELLVDIERLGGLPQHELELAQSPPPDAAVSGLNLSRHINYHLDF